MIREVAVLKGVDISDRPDAGAVTRLEEGLRRVLAPNPAPMTHWGTNTYILGQGQVAVIDPGPDSDTHLAALLDALDGQTVTHILVTHAHLDHSPLARRLAGITGAEVLGFGPPESGRSATMRALAENGLAGGGEGVDGGFAPDRALADGEVISADGWEVAAVWTPGHFAGHLCFDWNGRVFSGDHVMGWASTMISPPDGDVTAFMASCATLRQRGAVRLYPGHGAPVLNPDGRLDWLMRHRREREAQILAALGRTPLELRPLTRRIYFDAPTALIPAAERNVFAHLIDLEGRNLVRALPELKAEAQFIRN